RARLGSLRDGDAWVSPVLLAQVHAGLGDVDAALGCLEDAEEQRPPDLAWLAVRPTFAELREHDEVRALLTRMGLST
ncbi:MAG TPA: hypothetical protein VJ925_12330, partial [Longimicrobiales bacterium]|nr:hypothetical protein [Longimicrobiales bacterium]